MLDSNEADLTPYGLDTVIQAKTKDLGGFTVRRTLPYLRRRMVGPWIFFDHMGPAAFKAGDGISVRPHPHIGLATVTYLFEGAILHRDSLGSNSVIRPGDVNLMVAGKGIVHSERELPETLNTPRHLHGLQLWHALPEADEEMEAAFHHYDGVEIPATEIDGVPIRVLMGKAFGLTSPVKTFARTLLVEGRLNRTQSLLLPSDEAQSAIYVVSGVVSIGKKDGPGLELSAGAMAIYDGARDIVMTAALDAKVVIIGGNALSERYIYWNFVSSREDRLEQARDDWRNKRFGTVPGDEVEFIPLPDTLS